MIIPSAPNALMPSQKSPFLRRKRSRSIRGYPCPQISLCQSISCSMVLLSFSDYVSSDRAHANRSMVLVRWARLPQPGQHTLTLGPVRKSSPFNPLQVPVVYLHRCRRRRHPLALSRRNARRQRFHQHFGPGVKHIATAILIASDLRRHFFIPLPPKAETAANRQLSEPSFHNFVIFAFFC